MKVLTVVTKNGTAKEFPLLEDDLKIITFYKEIDALPKNANFVYVNPFEVALLAVLEYPEATTSESEEVTSYEVDSGPTL